MEANVLDYHEIGEECMIEGTIHIVKRAEYGCYGCAFKDFCDGPRGMRCLSTERKDRESIIYKRKRFK